MQTTSDFTDKGKTYVLDGRPVTLMELESARSRLMESQKKNPNEPPKKIVEVAPNEYKTKTVIQG